MNFDEIIRAQYRPLKLLGSEKNRAVYLVSEKTTGRVFVLKDIRITRKNPIGYGIYESTDPDIGSGEELMRYLNHKGIPKIHDFLTDGRRRIIIMEYIEGRNLWEESIQRGGIDEESLVKMMISICDILIYLHERNRPIIYRDIKPSNIIIGDDGNVSLIDFGSAITENSYCIAEGTEYYASPEHFGSRVDKRSDIYSLGQTAYRVSSSIRGTPFSNEFGAILKKATEMNPKLRYQNVYQLREELKTLNGKEQE